MKSPQEEIDRLVRERLLESEQAGGNWDLPSEKVWVEVEQRIQEKRRWRGAIWWMFGGMIVVVSAALFLFSLKERDPETVQGIANAISPVIETKQESGGNGENRGNGGSTARPDVSSQPLDGNVEEGDRGNRESVVNRESKAPQSDGDPMAASETNIEASTTTRLGSIITPTFKTAPDLNFTNSSQQHGQKAIQNTTDGSSESIRENAINPIIPSVAQTSRALIRLTFLQSDIGIQHNIDRALPKISKPAAMIPVVRPSVWSLAFVVSPALGTRKIVVPDAQPRVRRNLLLEQEEPAVQLGFGILATRALNTNWSIVGGVEYNRFLLNSSTTHQIRYSRIGERMNGRGNFENDYRLNLNTSYGEVSTDVIVERSSDSQISEHQFINLSLQTRQSMQVLEFPVSLKYTLPLNRLNFSCYGGLSANVLLENTLEFRAVQSQNNEILETRVARNAPLSGFRDVALGYQFGVGLEMPLQRQWSLIAGPSISGYLQPVYENRQVVIYPITFDLQIGLRYQL